MGGGGAGVKTSLLEKRTNSEARMNKWSLNKARREVNYISQLEKYYYSLTKYSHTRSTKSMEVYWPITAEPGFACLRPDYYNT